MTDDVGAVGFIGLGQIGGPMAARLVDWPGGLHVYDVRAEAAGAARGAGRRARRQRRRARRGLRPGVRHGLGRRRRCAPVVAELLTTARPGTVIAVHSTIRPETAEELADTASEQGIDVLDVPVSGGFMGAHEGTLAAMVGGDRAAYERAKPVFARWASLVVHMGTAGTGTRTKLAAQPHALHRLHRRGRGPAPGRGGGPRPPEAGPRGAPQRLGDGGSGSDHGPRHDGALGAGRRPPRDPHPHPHARERRTSRSPSSWPTALGLDLPLARQALEDFGPSLGLPRQP